MNGYCDIVILGDGFGQTLDAKFRYYGAQVAMNLLKREPFATLKDKIRFSYINSKASLGCAGAGTVGDASLLCDIPKIKKAIGKTPMNVCLILSWKNGFGGTVGTIAAVGLNQASDVNAQCPFEFRAFDGICIHELGHAFGCDHDFTSVNVMSYGTNGGCEIAGKPFTANHQVIITSFITAACQ